MVNNTEKNEQEQTIHYPFGGFYRKLLPAEETATTAPQTAQVVPIPAPADDTLHTAAEVTESAPRWVADVIGEDYKTWEKGHYAIDAGTGTGKTTFILEQLLPWVRMRRKAGGKKILYLCNRTSLEGEVIERIKACGENATYYEEDPGNVYFDNISVFCYQWLEHVLINDSARIERMLKNYDYVVADECHYFYSDAGLNPNTDRSYRYLEKISADKPVIYMSATADRMIEAWKNTGRIDANRIFRVAKDYSYIKSGMLYNNNAERRALLDEIPENEKAVVFVNSRKELVKLSEEYGEKAAYYCSSNNSGGALDRLEDCVKGGLLQKKILFTTVALYNGVDIKDKSLKHIFIELWHPVDVIQAIGRKRPVDAEDTCTVYFRRMAKGQAKGQLENIKYLLEPGAKWWKYTKTGNKEEWEKFLNKSTSNDQINEGVTLVYDHSTNKYTIKNMALLYYLDRKRELEKMCSDGMGYDAYMRQSVWNMMNIQPREFRLSRLEEYLKKMEGQLMPKEELREEIIRQGCILPDNGRSVNRGMGMNVLNKKIAKYNYQIVSETDWHRDSENYGKACWMVRRV